MRIDTDLADSVIAAVADQLGFLASFNPAIDCKEPWTLSTGSGETFVKYSGTKAVICGFLEGYSVMNLKAGEILNGLDNANRRLIEGAREKLR